jgi:hypothetical protein
MPIQIIDKPNWGNSLSALLSGGLEGFAGARKERKQQGAYEQAGLPRSYVNLPPEVVKELIKQRGAQSAQGIVQKSQGPEGQEIEHVISPADQKDINKRYSPYITELRKKQYVFSEIDKITKESMELLNSGEVNTGTWFSGLRPDRSQNEKTRKYMSNIEKLVALQGQAMGGRISDAAREQIKASKPSIDQPIGTQLAILNDIREPAVRGLVEYNTALDRIKQNGNRIPDNLDIEVRDYINNLSAPQQSEVGAVYEDDNGQKVNGLQYSPEKAPQQEVAASPEESLPAQIGRNLVSGAANAVAGFGAVPGNIAGLVKNIREGSAQRAAQRIPEHLREQYLQGQQSLPGNKVINTTQQILPSAEGIKNVASNVLPKDYLKPQGESEQLLQDIAQDIGASMFPFLGTGARLAKTGIKGAAKAIAPAITGNVAKYFAKSAGASEKEQEGVKIGTMLLTSFRLEPQINERADKLSPVDRWNVWSNMEKSERAVSNIQKAVKDKLSNKSLNALAYYNILTNPTTAIPKIAAAETAKRVAPFAVGKGVQLAYAVKHLFTVPAIRNEYAKMVAAGVRNNVPAIIKSANMLAKVTEKVVSRENP